MLIPSSFISSTAARLAPPAAAAASAMTRMRMVSSPTTYSFVQSVALPVVVLSVAWPGVPPNSFGLALRAVRSWSWHGSACDSRVHHPRRPPHQRLSAARLVRPGATTIVVVVVVIIPTKSSIQKGARFPPQYPHSGTHWMPFCCAL